jgi:5-oxoprolinase (ATP-hydrolysing)
VVGKRPDGTLVNRTRLSGCAAHWVNAIKKISVARGYDITRYTLQCFGGAGGQHAWLVADALGITQVFVRALAGVLTAYGMGLAYQNVIREQAVELKLSLAALPEIADALSRLTMPAQAELQRQQVSTGTMTTHQRVHVRYEGSDAALIMPFGTLDQTQTSFEGAYRPRFAFLMQGKGLVVEAVSVDAVLVVREDRQPGDLIAGPAIIAENNATTVVEPGWEARLTAFDHLMLDRRVPRNIKFAVRTTADPVLLEVFNNLFMNIAEQMGLQL